jgi:sortase A
VSPQRFLRGLSTVLIAGGLALALDVVVTLLWQEPLTALITWHHQDVLAGQLDGLEAQGPTTLEATLLRGTSSEPRRVALLAHSLRRRLRRGAAAGRLEIPRLGLDMVLVNGTDAASLREGPGVYDQTPFPGATSTTAIAGHRTTYLAPFRHLDELRRGDAIEVRMPYADFHYAVQSTQIVKPDALWILRHRGYQRLVLSACAPLFSASHRIVVFARLASVVFNRSFVESQGSAVKRRS